MARRAVGAKIGSFAIEQVNAAAGATISSLVEPWLRIVGQGANSVSTTVLPDIAALIQLYHMGLITEAALAEAASRHGIDIAGVGAGTPHSQLWNGIEKLSYAQFDPDTVQELYRMGLLNDQQFRDKMKLAGFNVGANIRHLSALNREPLNIELLIALHRRGLMTNQQVHADLKRVGITREAERAGIIQASQFVPGPSDLVQFMMRDTFDPLTVLAGKLDEDFAAKFQGDAVDWAAWNGITEEQMRHYWRAHWQYPASGQLFEMLRRLRPNRILDVQQLVPGARVVDLPRVIEQLKINDFAPGWVNEIAAISYRVITRRDLKLLIKRKQIDKKGAAAILEDNGYSPDDSAKLAESIWLDTRQDDLGPLISTSKGHIFDGLRIGAISDEQAKSMLFQHGLDKDEIEISLQNLHVEMQIDDIKKAQSAIRKMRISGALSQDEILNQLIGIGTAPERAAEFIFQWNLELQSGHKQLTAGEVVKLYVEGLLTYEQAYTRLDNIGYKHGDIELLLAEGRQKIELARARALVELAKGLEKQQKALVAQVKAAEAEHRDARTELARHGSPGQLAKWYSQGLISRQNGLDRLTALDWPIDDAEKLLDGSLTKPTAKVAPAQPPQVTTPIGVKPAKQHHLTEAQIVKGAKMELYSVDAALAMLMNLNLTEDDAKIILEEAGIKVDSHG